jgi:flagellar hook protein FlgE
MKETENRIFCFRALKMPWRAFFRASLVISCGSDTYNTQSPLGEIILTTTTDNDFFVLNSIDASGELSFTNSNTFNVDKDGYLVNSTGLALQVFPVDNDGNVLTTALSGVFSLQIPDSVGVPQATTSVSINAVLPSGINPAKLSTTLDTELASNPANPDPPSYHYPFSVTIYDSMGHTHNLTMFFIMTDIANKTWQIRTTIDGILALPFSTEILDFDNSGVLDITGNDGDGITTPASGVISYQSFNLSNGAAPLSISIDFRPQNSTTTHEGNSPFNILAQDQDGFATGRSTRLTIDSDGLITINFSNLSNPYLGKVALARFASPYNLRSEGDLLWSETTESGPAITGEAGTGSFGSIGSVSHDL